MARPDMAQHRTAHTPALIDDTTPGPLIMVAAFVGFVGGYVKALFGPEAQFLLVGATAAVALLRFNPVIAACGTLGLALRRPGGVWSAQRRPSAELSTTPPKPLVPRFLTSRWNRPPPKSA
jgi:hypothetical protein